MSSYFSHTSRMTKTIIIVEFILVSYLLYSLTKNIYNSYQLDQYIQTFEAENQALELENKRKTEDYLYFTSEEYIDKIAKQNLGLINPGEEVIILSPELFKSDPGSSIIDDQDVAVEFDNTVVDQWWKFFFH